MFQLFSQVLLGYNSNQNWDQLVQRLEENHGILTQMVEKGEDSESTSELPKLLLELVSQVDECDAESQKEEQIEENVNTDEVNNSVDKDPGKNLTFFLILLKRTLSNNALI